MTFTHYLKNVSNSISERFSIEEWTLLSTILILTIVFAFLGNHFSPVIASLVIAYLLDGVVKKLKRYGCPHLSAVLIAYISTLSIFLLGSLWLFPIVWQQARHLLQELPNTITLGQNWLMQLGDIYPDYISFDQIKQWVAEFKLDFAKLGQTLLSASVNSIPGIITAGVYLVLVPFLVYFFLIDKDQLLRWIENYLPQHRLLLKQVWLEVHDQIGNYIRGRIIEIIIVGIVCYLVFSLLGLRYALLLSALVGLSTIIPYIGAVAVAVPLFLVGLWQWGLTINFVYLLIAFTVLITIDAYVIVPLLFSEVVSLHPVAIILAVLFLGSLGGFWGVFFAIPFAILIKAIMHAFENKKLNAI